MNIEALSFLLHRGSPWLADSASLVAWAARFSLSATTAGLQPGKAFDGSDLPRVEISGGVMTIPVCGPLLKAPSAFERASGIASYGDIEAALQTAQTTPGIRGVALRVDSPGGSYQGAEECADAVAACAKKLPVVAHVDGVCASAAFWLASQCRTVVASKSSSLGSVGAITTLVSVEKALKAAGVDARVFASPVGKGAGHPFAPISDETSATWQARIEDAAQTFRESVTKSRPSMAAAALSGAMFFSPRAKALGLCDEIGRSLGEVVRSLAAPGAQLSAAADPKDRWAADKKLQAEFSTAESYAGYCRAVALGRYIEPTTN